MLLTSQQSLLGFFVEEMQVIDVEGDLNGLACAAGGARVDARDDVLVLEKRRHVMAFMSFVAT